MSARHPGPRAEFELADLAVRLPLGEQLQWRALGRGTLRLTGALGDHTVSRTLDLLDEVRLAGLPEVRVHITSPGGDAYAALALFDALGQVRADGTRVVTVVDGYAASAAVLLVQAGDHRVLRPHARLLIHEVRRWGFGLDRMSDLEDEAAELRAVSDDIYRLLAARSGQSLRAIRALATRPETWLSAEQALAHGLADTIA